MPYPKDWHAHCRRLDLEKPIPFRVSLQDFTMLDLALITVGSIGLAAMILAPFLP